MQGYEYYQDDREAQDSNLQLSPRHNSMPVVYENPLKNAFKELGTSPILGGNFSVHQDETGNANGDCMHSLLINAVTGAVVIGVGCAAIPLSGPTILGMGLITLGFGAATINDHLYTWRVAITGRIPKEKHNPSPGRVDNEASYSEPPPVNQVKRPARAASHFDHQTSIDAPTVVVGADTKMKAIAVDAKPVSVDLIDDAWLGWDSDPEKLQEEVSLATKGKPPELVTKPIAPSPARMAAEQLASKLLNGANPPESCIHEGRWVMKWSCNRMVELYPTMTQDMWSNAFSNIASNIPESYIWDSSSKVLIKL